MWWIVPLLLGITKQLFALVDVIGVTSEEFGVFTFIMGLLCGILQEVVLQARPKHV